MWIKHCQCERLLLEIMLDILNINLKIKNKNLSQRKQVNETIKLINSQK